MNRRGLIIKYHTICKLKGLTGDEKGALLDAFGVDSSKDLSDAQLIRLIDKLQDNRNDHEADLLRKRVMAVIGSWLRNRNIQDNAEFIKAIACRASGYKEFNKIPNARLSQVYFEFMRKEEVARLTDIIKQEVIDYVAIRN